MSSIRESIIRDHLVTRLAVLEPGLQHLVTEHTLRNPFGTKGSIDILARDLAGHRIIIEIKRSNASARAAIHELCKYVALFKMENGLRSDRIRCFVVSTEWDELLTPFQEFARSSEFQVEGFRLEVDDHGVPLRSIRVTVDTDCSPVVTHRVHDILLYAHAESRDANANAIADAMVQCGATTVFLCLLDCLGVPSVIYPHALYCVVGGLEASVRESITHELDAQVDSGELHDYEDYLIEQMFSLRLQEHPAFACDSYEIGYPEKLSSCFSAGWKCRSIIRRGRMASAFAASDEELLRTLKGLDGSHSYIYSRVATPRVHKSWENFIESAATSLYGNSYWRNDFIRFAELVRSEYPNALVTANIYNPTSLLYSITSLVADGDPRFMPALEIVSAEDGSDVMALVSRLCWNGQVPVQSIDELLHGLEVEGMQVSSVDSYMVIAHFGHAWALNDALAERFALEYETVVLRYNTSRSPDVLTLLVTDGRPELVPQKRRCLSLKAYIAEHGERLRSVCAPLARVTTTLDGKIRPT